MASLVPFGVKWPVTAALKDRRAREREAFVEWIDGLDVPEDQRRVLSVLLGMVDDVELVDGRCAGVTYPAEVARRAGELEDVDRILPALEAAAVVEVARMVGPMWSANGRPVVVPPGASAPAVVLAHVASVVTAPGPWPVRVTDRELVLDLVLGVDGSVTEGSVETPAAGRWWRR